MQALPLLEPIVLNSAKMAPEKFASHDGDCASAEIYSFIAARNLLLHETEKNPTELNLSRAEAANRYVESCLRPMASPYQAQSLSETEAARERQRCLTVRALLCELRIRSGLGRRAA